MLLLAPLKWLWVLVLPWVGPLLPPLLRHAPAADTLKRWARRLFIALLVVATVACLWVWVKTRRDPVSEYVSSAEVLREQHDLMQRSVSQLQRSLDTRERQNAVLEREIQQLRDQLEAAREKSPDPDVVVYPADDPWLRAKRGR